MIEVFCEQCGKPLIPGGLYCQACGHRIRGLSELPRNRPNGDRGDSSVGGRRSSGGIPDDFLAGRSVQLWITNSYRLEQEVGPTVAKQMIDLLRNRLGPHGRNAGILIDLASELSSDNAGWADHVSCINRMHANLSRSSGIAAGSICLAGNERVIPMAVFADVTRSDTEVETDLCYATGSVENPWFDEAARSCRWGVARLPLGASWGLEALRNYLANRNESSVGSFPSGLPFGFSAHRWEKASQAALRSIGGGLVETSPLWDHGNLERRWNTRSPWLYFNLHGAREEPAWYGEGGGEFPVAFLPRLAAGLQSPNVIGVEACYGARFSGLTAENSVLLSALSHRTVAFLGSSSIAFGPPSPPNSLADVIVRDFLVAMRQGLEAGVAHLHARNAVLAELGKDTMDPQLCIKTAASFNLFGDPSVTMGVKSTGLARLTNHPRVELRDTIRTVRDRLDSSIQETETRLQQHLEGSFPVLKDVRPRVEAIVSTSHRRHRWHWQAKAGPLDSQWILLTDESGRILAEFHSR
jgi:hypothetical protein